MAKGSGGTRSSKGQTNEIKISSRSLFTGAKLKFYIDKSGKLYNSEGGTYNEKGNAFFEEHGQPNNLNYVRKQKEISYDEAVKIINKRK